MAKRVEPARTGDERRRGPREASVGSGAQRRSGDAPPRGRRSTREQRPVRKAGAQPPGKAERSAPHTSPTPRVGEGSTRPKNAAQAKARSKARKAKAPKLVRIPLRERLLIKLSSIDFDPRRFVTRVPFVVLVIGALGLGLGVTLWLSTDAAQRSYQLGHARQVNQALMQQKDGLERQVLEAQAAPALAEAARDLGMIPSRDTAHLVQDLSGNWIVVGTPRPAEGVPPPPLNSPLPEPTTPGPPPPPAPRVVEPREVAVRVTPQPAPLPNPEASVPATAIAAPVPGAVPAAAPVPAEVPAPAAPLDATAHLEPLQAPALPGPVPTAEPVLPVPAPGAPA